MAQFEFELKFIYIEFFDIFAICHQISKQYFAFDSLSNGLYFFLLSLVAPVASNVPKMDCLRLLQDLSSL